MNTVSVPTPEGVTREQISELSRLAKLYGLRDISHLGSGINLTNFAGGGPTGKEISGYLRRGMLPQNEKRIGPGQQRLADAIREVVPDAGMPVRAIRTGPYVDYSPIWNAEPGSGAGTGRILGVLDKEPVLAERANKSVEIANTVRAMGHRDQVLSAAYGLPMSEDVQNMQRIIGEGGPGLFDRLRTAHARGVYLPAATLAALGLGAAAQSGDSRSSSQRDY